MFIVQDQSSVYNSNQLTTSIMPNNTMSSLTRLVVVQFFTGRIILRALLVVVTFK